MGGVCGTPGYIPPETWQRNYWIPKGDVFSMGVIFFQILGGISGLFAEHMRANTMEDIARCTCTAQPPFEWFNDKPDFQMLVAVMLEKDPARRCTMTHAGQSPWFSQYTGAPIDPQVVGAIKGINQKSEAQHQMAELMLDRFNLGGLRNLNQAFAAMDTDNSGTLTMSEAYQAVAQVGPQLGLNEADAEGFIRGLADSSGNITYRRFMASMIQHQKGFATADLWARFCEIDRDRNGVLDKQEMVAVIQSMNYSEQESVQLFNNLDRDGDGIVTFDEFKALVVGSDVSWYT